MPTNNGVFTRTGGTTRWTDDAADSATNYINAGKMDGAFNEMGDAINAITDQTTMKFRTSILLPSNHGYAWDGDSDTGTFRLADGTVVVKCNGSNRFAITPEVASSTGPMAVGTPTHADHATTKSYVDAATGDTSQVPVGGTLPYFGASAPEGYLLCNGATVSRTTYADLFAVIGTTHGTTDSTNFKVPDCRGMFLRGTDLSRGVDVNRTLGSQQEDATAKNGLSVSEVTISSAGDHAHPLPYGTSNNSSFGSDPRDFEVSNGQSSSAANTGSAGAHTHEVSGGVLSDGDSETRPVNLSCNFIIKT